MPHHVNVLTGIVIGAAIEVHRVLGPGLLESAYHKCLAQELYLRGVQFDYKLPLPLEYKGIKIRQGYQLDLLVEKALVVEVKAIAQMAPVHEAQLLTYMRLGGWPIGLLLNFNVAVLKDGIRRRVLNLDQ